MNSLYITHYYVKGTDPWKNIMLLPEEEAFQKAAVVSIIFRTFSQSTPGRNCQMIHI